MLHGSSGNQVVPAGLYGNQLVLFDDIPLYWDAWDCMDYHLETRTVVNDSRRVPGEAVHVELATPLEVILKWSQAFGKESHLEQRIRISAVHPHIEFETRIKWAENRKFLKVEFPVDVLASQVNPDLCSISVNHA